MNTRASREPRPHAAPIADNDCFEQLMHLVSMNGYAFTRTFLPKSSTQEIAIRLGSILDPQKIAPGHGIATVQTLKPRESSDLDLQTYGGVYGRNEFPLHSDYAHWGSPPHFLMLRCLEGTPSVSTYLLPASDILEHADGLAERAVVVPRRAQPGRMLCPMPVCFRDGGYAGLRWDYLFLKPLNQAAIRVGESIKSIQDIRRIDVCLADPGDTLIIDNWRMLHGRSSVPSATHRRLERIYVSKLWEQ
ncbi:Fe(II)-2OG oxygenase family protein [Pseudomonas neuropathica]|nr:TauD/TfdA family dioxygenase [Pseudomonas neuropathica]